VAPERTVSGGKAVLKEAAKESFVLRERNEAIAYVARRKDAILPAQAARAAAIVSDRDHR
jgi:hypothetical protein